MIACQKDKFSIPENITYLNCSYMSPLPTSVETAGIKGLKRKKSPWEILPDDFFNQTEQVKALFAKLINSSDSQQIAIIPSVSYGIANAVKNINPKPGQNIVMLEEQFPSNFYSWEKLSKSSGCELRIVKSPDSLESRGEKWNAAILESINENTVAVAIAYNHWADGTRFNLKAIREKANRYGTFLIVDGTQSIGAMPFDISEIQPDALICGAYKWLLGPYSFGLAYYSKRFDNAIPIEENWMNRLDSENFQNLVNYQSAYKLGANRFCVGESSHFIAMPMMKAALNLLLEWQSENIQEYCGHISAEAIDAFKEKGCWIEHSEYRSNHLIGVRFPENIDMEKIKAKAIQEDIFVSFRGNAMRISPHLYNTKTDFRKLIKLID